MGLQLPGPLVELLALLGYSWPEADEQKLFEMGQAWLSFAGPVQSVLAEVEPAAASIWSTNQGSDIAAFRAAWTHEDGPAPVLRDGQVATELTGIGLMTCAAIVLALKMAVIVQLTILAAEIAEALATAGPTFGASLAEIPIFQQLARKIVGNLFQEVLFQLVDA